MFIFKPAVRVFALGEIDIPSAYLVVHNNQSCFLKRLDDSPAMAQLKALGAIEDACRSDIAALMASPLSREISHLSCLSSIAAGRRVSLVAANSRVLIVGIGGLGCHIAEHLARIGISGFTIIDPDSVEQSNLNRQILFDKYDVGVPKVEAAALRLQRLSPSECKVEAYRDVAAFIQSESAWDFAAAFVTADSAPFELRRCLIPPLYQRSIPYFFAGYVGHTGLVNPGIVRFDEGCGNCFSFCVEPERLRAFVPPSSYAVNAIISAICVEEWLKVLLDPAAASNFCASLNLSDYALHRYKPRALDACPTCHGGRSVP